MVQQDLLFQQLRAGYSHSIRVELNLTLSTLLQVQAVSITPSGATSVNYGANQTYTIAATTGYTLSSVTVDGVSVGSVTSYTFSSVTANHTIAAAFTPVTSSYALTVTRSGTGTGTSNNKSHRNKLCGRDSGYSHCYGKCKLYLYGMDRSMFRNSYHLSGDNEHK